MNNKLSALKDFQNIVYDYKATGYRPIFDYVLYEVSPDIPIEKISRILGFKSNTLQWTINWYDGLRCTLISFPSSTGIKSLEEDQAEVLHRLRIIGLINE